MRATARRCGWAVVGLLAAAPVSAARERDAARPELAVLWSDPEQRVPAVVKRLLYKETAALFASWGVTIRSSEGLDSRGQDDVRVVLLDRTRLGNHDGLVLGETHATPLEHPAVWILVPNVRQVVERRGEVASSPVLARALARVAAHEILHTLGLGHAPLGIMRCAQGTADLTTPWVRVSDGFRRTLLEALRPRGRRAALDRPWGDLTASQSTPDRLAMAAGATPAQLAP